jgi:phosphoglycolate phosphatase
MLNLLNINSLINNIIWDFNGTLLNDMQVCIDCINIMLKERNLPALELDRYREIFTFPVKDYYLSLGFDFHKEPFEIPAHQFIDLYREYLHLAPLQPDAVETLEFFSHRRYQQEILSAMEQEFLEDTLKSKGILKYFDKISGITNHLGEGKLEMAKEMISRSGRKPDEICMIGDTVHDFEVAQGSGISCILIARGHQSYERLKVLDCLVLKDMKSLKNIFS